MMFSPNIWLENIRKVMMPMFRKNSSILVNVCLLYTSTCIAVGERYSLPQNIEQNLIPGYVEHGLSVSREFEWKNCALRLQAECVNFTDKQYAVIKDYPMPGRSWRFTGRCV